MPSYSRLLTAFFVGLPIWAASPATPGIDNFHQIDSQVYRGAQPTAEGFQYLSRMGVKVILDLREHDRRSTGEEHIVTAAGMRYVNVAMTGMTPPTESQIHQILALLEDPSAGPVFVHCKRGADRTGAVIAAYRIDHDKWDNARALSEAKADRMSSFQFQRQAYIRSFHGLSAGAASTSAEADTKN
ncbi:MAG TPA: tyrosine-protein phosphatase [Verrucomicrobiae bacterium]|nr:tyrosine-protein phosphatase [Verrucomicrobiae bacterium]